MSEPNRSPLASLVLFMFCLSIAGSALAGAHYYAVDLPQQKNLQAPENAEGTTDCKMCKHNCIIYIAVDDLYYSCIDQCKDLTCGGNG